MCLTRKMHRIKTGDFHVSFGITMETVYMDESGYTGYDLLNLDQPVQAASSLMIDEKTAQGLIVDTFPKSRAKELKHKKISKSHRGRCLLSTLILTLA